MAIILLDEMQSTIAGVACFPNVQTKLKGACHHRGRFSRKKMKLRKSVMQPYRKDAQFGY